MSATPVPIDDADVIIGNSLIMMSEARAALRCSCRTGFSTVRMTDQIAVADGGTLTEVGRYYELIDKPHTRKEPRR